jgi:hypothetical protein
MGLREYKNSLFKEDLFLKRLSDNLEGFVCNPLVTITDIATLEEFWATGYGQYLRRIDTPFQAVLRGTYEYPPPSHVLNIFKTGRQGDFSDYEKKLLETVGRVFSSGIARYKQHLQSRDFRRLLDFETEKTDRALAVIDDKKQQVYCNRRFAEKISGIFGASSVSESMNKLYAAA